MFEWEQEVGDRYYGLGEWIAENIKKDCVWRNGEKVMVDSVDMDDSIVVEGLKFVDEGDHEFLRIDERYVGKEVNKCFPELDREVRCMLRNKGVESFYEGMENSLM